MQLFIDVPLDVIRIMQGTIMVTAVIPLVRRADMTFIDGVHRRRRSCSPRCSCSPLSAASSISAPEWSTSPSRGTSSSASFVGILAADATGSGTLGLGAGVVAGAVVGWLFSFIVTRLQANMIIVGLGLNTRAVRVGGPRAGRALRQPLGVPARRRHRTAGRSGSGFLADVPVLGPLFASNDVVVWSMVPAVVAVGWALARTRWGLRVRAAGGDAATSTTLGIAVPAVQQRAGVVAGALAGLGGAHLSIAVAGLFSPGISAGRGYIALAAVYFGRARPLPTTLAAVIYVVFDATQIRLQLRLPDIPVQLVETLPYVAVIVALTVSAAASRRTRAI